MGTLGIGIDQAWEIVHDRILSAHEWGLRDIIESLAIVRLGQIDTYFIIGSYWVVRTSNQSQQKTTQATCYSL